MLFMAAHTHTTSAGVTGIPKPNVVAPSGQTTKSLGE
jgi:hypothetical protein